MGHRTVSDFVHDREIINYEVPVLAGPDVEALTAALRNPSTRWYALKRLTSFTRLGLISAGGWNPLLHPRGHDGKFIVKFGWVRALINGKWERGYVTGINSEGLITVEYDHGKTTKTYTNFEASKSLYATPKPKARLDLPELGKPNKDWTAVGGQAGSNPGGKYQLDAEKWEPHYFTSGQIDVILLNNDLQIGGSGISKALGGLDKIDSYADLPDYGFLVVKHGPKQYSVFSTIRDADGKLNVIDVESGEPLVVGENSDWPPPVGSMTFQVDYHPETEPESAIDAINRRIAALRAQLPAVPENGDEVYVKRSKTPQHAKNEVLANRFYELAGVPVPDVHAGSDPLYVGSKILSGDIVPLNTNKADPEVLSQIRENMVVDAWLANWDAVGLAFDNIVIVNGTPVRIDAGGALLYRAQGSPKGNKFGGEVIELKTFRSNLNPQANTVFGPATPEELKRGAERVAAISPNQIRTYVDESGLGDSLANTLIARRADIIEKLLDGVDPYAPKATKTPEVPLDEYPDEKLIEVLTTLLEHGVDSSKVEKVLNDRGLSDKITEVKESVQQLRADNVDPKYKISIEGPTTDPDSSVDMVINNDPNAQWLWDNVNSRWYRGDKVQESQVSVAAEEVADLVASYPPFNGDVQNAVPTSIDDFFDVEGDIKPDMIGKWIWLGGSMWEIDGPGEVMSLDGAVKHKGIKLKNIGSGATVSVPRSAYFKDNDFSSYHKTEGNEIPTNLGFVVDPGDDRDDLRTALRNLYGMQLNSLISKGYDAPGKLPPFRPAADASRGYSPDRQSYVAIETQIFGANWSAPPSQLDGLTPSTWSNAPMFDTTKLEVAYPNVSAMTPMSIDSIGDLPVGAYFVVNGSTVFRVSKGNQIELVDFRYKSSVPLNLPGASVNRGELYSMDDFDVADVNSVWKPNDDYLRLRAAVAERERILKEAAASLDAALLVEMQNDDVGSMGVEEIATFSSDDDDTLPGSVEAFAQRLAATDKPLEFSPKDSPLKFVGVITGEQLKPGMWIMGAPESAHAFPMKVTDVAWAKDTDQPTLASFSYQRLDGYKGTINEYNMSPMFALERGQPSKTEPASKFRILVIQPPGIPLSQPTIKKSGEIALDGLIVGKWEHADYEGNPRHYTIFGQFSPTGRDFSVSAKPSQAKGKLSGKIILPKKHTDALTAKSAKAKKRAGQIKWKVGKLGDGTKVEAGMPVRSVVTGNEGVLVGSIHPSRDDLVYVKFSDDRVDVLDTTALVSIGKPKTTKKAAPTAPAVKISSDLPHAVVEAMETTPASFVMGDGVTPMLGMKVEAGKGAKSVTGTVIAVNKAGYMRVQDDDGNSVWRSIKVGKALESPSFDSDPAVKGTTSTMVADTDLPDVAGSPVSPATPDLSISGVKFLQSKERIDKYVEDGGITTFDGFIPDIGLPVFDRQGNRLTIALRPASNRDVVHVYDAATPGKLKSRKIANLTVDIASYSGEHGAISDIAIVANGQVAKLDGELWKPPDGSSIYRVATKNYGSSTARNQSKIYVVTPSGQVYMAAVDHKYGSGGYVDVPAWAKQGYSDASKDFFLGSYVNGKIEKLGVFNAAEGTTIVWQPVKKHDETPVIAVGDFGDSPDFPQIIADAKAAEAPKVLDAKGNPVLPVPADIPAGEFGEPPDAAKHRKGPVGAAPVVTGAGADFSATPEGLHSDNLLSVSAAMRKVIDAKDSKAPNSGVTYATMDEDYVEDTLLRFQVVTDGDREYVELRMRLQEERSEEVSNDLLVSSSTKYGGWTQSNTVYPTDLVEGDYIDVYKSSQSGALKPVEEASTSNARVTGNPELIGVSDKSGFDVYRVPVVLHTGEAAYVDMELRENATVGTMRWDPDMAVQVAFSASNYDVSPGAKDAGWVAVASQITTPYPKHAPEGGPILLTETGVGKLNKTHEQNPSNGLSMHGGATMYRTMPDGTVVRFNAVPSSSGGTSQGDPRRSELARDVRIRVPLDAEDIQGSLSRGLEAVGIPPEKQKPPPPETFVRIAMNKMQKQFAPTFKHREKVKLPTDRPIKPDEPEIVNLLAEASQRVGLGGKDAITLDDIEIAVAPNGRVTQLVSKRVARAISKRQGNKYYRHYISGSTGDRVVGMLSGAASTGLFSSDERFSLGIMTLGKSSSTDMYNGAGDRVYVTGVTSTHINGDAILSADTVNRTLDGYVNGNDGFGHRTAKNNFVKHGGAYEYMIKRKFEPEQIAYFLIESYERQSVLDRLHAAGVTHIGSRPIEEVIVSTPPLADDKFQELGSDALAVAGTVGSLLSGSAGAGTAAP